MSKRKAKRRVIAVNDVINIYDDKMTDSKNQGMGHNVPPLINHVAIYFLQQNLALPDAKMTNCNGRRSQAGLKKIGKF
jgi:hypothetical protein